jgi:hypothetical protein
MIGFFSDFFFNIGPGNKVRKTQFEIKKVQRVICNLIAKFDYFNIANMLQTSVSQPPGRLLVPGIDELFTGTWNIGETKNLSEITMK